MTNHGSRNAEQKPKQLGNWFERIEANLNGSFGFHIVISSTVFIDFKLYSYQRQE